MRLLSLLFLTTVPLALAFPVEEGWANSTAVEPVHGPHVKRDGPPKEGGDWREEYLLEEEIAIKVAGTNYALDNTDGTAKGGTQIWQYHGGENQRWLRFNWHDWEGRTTLHYRKFKLQRKNSNLCLHFKHDSESLLRGLSRLPVHPHFSVVHIASVVANGGGRDDEEMQ